MKEIITLAVYLTGIVFTQNFAHAANTTIPSAVSKSATAHSSVGAKASNPNIPRIVESSKEVSASNPVFEIPSMEEYIVGGYDKWGGYDSRGDQPDGSVILEYDMKISQHEYRKYYQGDDKSLEQTATWGDPGTRRFRRKALLRPGSHWPGAVIPYQISKDYSIDDIQVLKASMKAWEDRTCIRFVPAQPHHKNILRIQSVRGCNSFIGMVGGIQQLNLSKKCRVKHVVVHELGHVIGLIHEHQRPDRDRYLKILTKHVGANKLVNFRKFRPERVSSFGVQYDYTSIMHYGKKAFSKGGKQTTMVTLDSRFQDIIGKARKMSFSDAKVVNIMYDCAGACDYVDYHCTTGYMDHTCRCVCRDGSQRCVQTLRPVERKPANLSLAQIFHFFHLRNLARRDDDDRRWRHPRLADFAHHGQTNGRSMVAD